MKTLLLSTRRASGSGGGHGGQRSGHARDKGGARCGASIGRRGVMCWAPPCLVRHRFGWCLMAVPGSGAVPGTARGGTGVGVAAVAEKQSRGDNGDGRREGHNDASVMAVLQ
jgi:hypothetical protein